MHPLTRLHPTHLCTFALLTPASFTREQLNYKVDQSQRTLSTLADKEQASQQQTMDKLAEARSIPTLHPLLLPAPASATSCACCTCCTRCTLCTLCTLCALCALALSAPAASSYTPTPPCTLHDRTLTLQP